MCSIYSANCIQWVPVNKFQYVERNKPHNDGPEITQTETGLFKALPQSSEDESGRQGLMRLSPRISTP
jgi:hypothetical protein